MANPGPGPQKYLSLHSDLNQQSEHCDWLRKQLKSKAGLKYVRELQPSSLNGSDVGNNKELLPLKSR